MPKSQKSPQERKSLMYERDHYTPPWHSSAFPNTWKRKKKLANHEYRRKSDELLAQVKPGMAAYDAASLTEHLTPALFRRSVLRKRIRKSGAVSIGEKVKRTLENREERVNRRRKAYEPHDRALAEAVATLTPLEGDQLAAVVKRANEVCGAPYSPETLALEFSADPIDRAISFLEKLFSGTGGAHHILCRNPELRQELAAWLRKADRLLAKQQRVIDRKDAEKHAAVTRINALRRMSSTPGRESRFPSGMTERKAKARTQA